MRISDWSSDVCSSDLTGKTRNLPPSERPPQPPTTSDLSHEMRTAIGMRTLESSPPWKLAADADTGPPALLTRSGQDQGLNTKPDVQPALLPNAGYSRHHPVSAHLSPERGSEARRVGKE